jgi:transposase-like protein
MGRRRFTPMTEIVAQVPWQVTPKVRKLPRKATQLVEAAMQSALSQHPLSWITQWGARLMLQVALEEEVMAFLERDWYERKGGGSPGWRNGSKSRRVKVGGGDLLLPMPQVRGAGQPFHSRLLPPYTTRLSELEEVIPLLYLHGLSTRRIRKALGKLLGKRGLSPTTVVRLTQKLTETFEAWRKRDLSPREVVYLFLDGIRLGVRRGSREKEAILVAHAVLADGRREVLAVALGSRESTRAWTDLLEDLRGRGLSDPVLIITDGGPGLLAAVEAHFPEVLRQHCTKHKLANLLEKVPRGCQGEVGDAARRVLYAPTLAQAEEALVLFERAYRKRFPSAVECLRRDLQACWTYYRFPLRHWRRIRTINVLERSFREVRRRVRQIGRFQDELRALAMVHALLQEAQTGWQALSMSREAQCILEAMRTRAEAQAA